MRSTFLLFKGSLLEQRRDHIWIIKILEGVFEKTPAIKVYLFGSWARGTQTAHSDIDMIIIAETERDFFHRHLDFMEIYRRLDDYAIDLLIYTPEEFDRMQDRFFIQSAVKESKLIYEYGKKAA